MKSITLPSTLKVIEDRAFQECASLTSIDFPSTLESIGKNAFMRSGLETLNLSNTLATISVDVPAQLMNDRTMVPSRVIAEAFGADVQWNGIGKTVLINE